MAEQPYTIERYDSREPWIAAGFDTLGASESAVLYRCHSHQTLRSIWWAKRFRMGWSDDESIESSFGLYCEGFAATRFAEAMSCAVHRPDGYLRYIDSANRMSATLDGWLDDGSPVEFKTAYNAQARLWDREVPYGYQVQLMQQLAVTGAQRGYFAALLFLGGPPVFRLHPMDRDETLIADLRSRVATFWRFVDQDVKPPVDDSPITAEAIARQYSAPRDEEISLPVEFMDMRAEWLAEKERIEQAESKLQLIGNRIRDALGDNTVGKFADGRKVTWKIDRSGKRRFCMPNGSLT